MENEKFNGCSTLLLASTACLLFAGHERAEAQSTDPVPAPAVSLWDGNTRELFQRGSNEVTLNFGPGFGMPVLGSELHHNWVIGMAQYGRMLTGVLAEDHWYRGNVEVTGDLFGGFQYHPTHAYVVGIGPSIRYNFVTGTRWVPYFTFGVGVTATDIRSGDLSTEFEFNIRGGPGIRYLLNRSLALNLEYNFIHLSNAGMASPNLGVNNSTIFAGVSWFY